MAKLGTWNKVSIRGAVVHTFDLISGRHSNGVNVVWNCLLVSWYCSWTLLFGHTHNLIVRSCRTGFVFDNTSHSTIVLGLGCLFIGFSGSWSFHKLLCAWHGSEIAPTHLQGRALQQHGMQATMPHDKLPDNCLWHSFVCKNTS